MIDSPDAICRVQNLGKVYRYFRDSRGRMREWLSFGQTSGHEDIVALEDVSFEIKRGGFVGLIGHNGAGKSTLLRVLAGLTPPTSGSYAIDGRCYALTDIAIGFHPEFSGRENARFSTDLLRFPRKERRRKLDEILEFADLGDAVERPLKTYSTGMMMRLGFSVAIQVEPDLLLVDEVLAVGDAHFTIKCIDAMADYRRKGGTIVFCSHDINEIRRHCDSCLWIDQARLKLEGPTVEVSDSYLQHVRRLEREQAKAHLETLGREKNWPRVTRVWMTAGEEGRQTETVDTGNDVSVHIEYEAPDPDLVFNIGIRVDRTDNMFCFGSSAHHEGYSVPLKLGKSGVHSGCATFRMPGLRLLTGEYTVSVFLADDRSMLAYHEEVDAVRFFMRHEGRDTGLFRADTSWVGGSPARRLHEENA